MLGFLPSKRLGLGLESWGCFCNEIGIARFWSILMAPPSILFVAVQVSRLFAPLNFPSSFKKLRKSEKRKGKLVFEQGIFEASGFENCYDLKDKHNLVFISFVLCSESFRVRNATVQFRLAAYFLSKTFFRTPLLD